MSFAFSRDNALPGSRFWSQVNKRTQTPTNSIWLCVGVAIVLVIPAIWNYTAYAAVTSIAVIGLYIAYVIPVLLRRLQGKAFQTGPFSLGRLSPFIGWVAVVWVVFITILFVLPPLSPVTVSTFNYAPVAVVVVVLLAVVLWFAYGKRTFMTHAEAEHLTIDAGKLLDDN
jgi:amino acid transporter